LEDIEISDNEDSIYVKRFVSKKPKPTIITKNNCQTKIIKCKVIEGGFFTGKYMGFDIVVEGINLNVTREEYDFKWLRDSLKKEFPYACVPFLLKSHLKVKQFYLQ
jgi:hypothetical protein